MLTRRADGEAMSERDPVTMRLVVTCPDRVGIVAAVARFLAEAGANIESSHQYSSDPSDGTFFLRMQFVVPSAARPGLAERFGPEVAERFGMTWRDRRRARSQAHRGARLAPGPLPDGAALALAARRARRRAGARRLQPSGPALRGRGGRPALPPHSRFQPKDKPVAEAALLALLDGHCDLVVLARYMQVLSGELLERLAVPIINIHHSFLPAFAGAGPYERAHERGVKLVGATAHYVTEDLDEGPIIEQDVIRVNHEHDVASLKRLGAHIERSVLARAVQWHCQDRVLRHRNTTVVF